MQVQRFIETVESSHLTLNLPQSFVNHKVEVLVITLDEADMAVPIKRRLPPPQFAGRVKEFGDVMSSIPPSDWGMEE